jgi:hypothetical protein
MVSLYMAGVFLLMTRGMGRTLHAWNRLGVQRRAGLKVNRGKG